MIKSYRMGERTIYYDLTHFQTEFLIMKLARSGLYDFSNKIPSEKEIFYIQKVYEYQTKANSAKGFQ